MAGDKEQKILDQYEAWEPDEQTVSELVDSLAISRQRLYQVLDKHGVVPKTRRRAASRGAPDGDLLQEMAEMALGYLLGQLYESRNELTRYRETYGPLSARGGE